MTKYSKRASSCNHLSIYSARYRNKSFATAILPRGELQSDFGLPLAVTIPDLAGDLSTRAARP